MKKYFLSIALLVAPFSELAAQSQAGDQKLVNLVDNYKIGVGGLSQLSANSDKHEFGVDWNGIGTCGDFDMDFSIKNTLNKEDLKRMMNGWIMQAKNAIDPASLLALAFKRANPDLYEQIMDGILQAKLQFADDNQMCQKIQDTILNSGDDAVKKLTVKQEYAEKVNTAYEGKVQVDINDVTDFIYDAGDNGVDINGTQYGGVNQEPIKITEHAVLNGINSLAGRVDDTDSSEPFNVSPQKIEDEYGVLKYFESPVDAVDYITSIVGETEITTQRDSNGKTHTKPLGISHQVFLLQKDIIEDIEGIITSISDSDNALSINNNINNFNKNISPSMVSRGMFNELISMGDSESKGYIQALSKEFASQITIEKTLVARRILYTGMLNAGIQDTGFMPEDIERKLELLDWEMDNLERENRFRSHFHRNASLTLLQRSIKSKMSNGLYIESQSGVFK